MLTKQHRYASKLLGSQRRQAYRQHMCGLCHALGDGYGLLARWLTSHEMILLNLLTSAQTAAAPEVVMRRCPLNPLLQVQTNQDAASTFAAGAAVSLAHISVADDVADEGGLTNRVLHWFLGKPAQAALASLQNLGFETEALAQLSHLQAAAEQQAETDPTRPSALTSAKLFAMTAQLAQQPQNHEVLAVIGANYGAYLYLMDAYRDYPRDMVRGDYNPLRQFTTQNNEQFSLSIEGIRWLRGRFEQIEKAIRAELPRLTLHRYQDLITTMLTEPLQSILRKLNAPLTFQRWGAKEALQAGLFLLPITATMSSGGEPHLEPDELPMVEVTEEQKRREKRGIEAYACFDVCCYNSHDAYLCANCGCEGLECATDNNGCGDGCDVGDGCGGADCNCN